ncbi:hypothetical protein GY45DRAFT_1328894 [Cubamyces sp. BRFM 1775]|nr:hypothetical protein GY45DRAFT_1328894 [Cubamyces sp. BRFM 1775]
MPVPLLNDDVLRQILSYLWKRDALNVALCSRHLYDLALPRVAAIAATGSPTSLHRLWAYMLSGTPPHAQYLEDLSITLTTFDCPDYDDYWDFSQAPLIGDLLLAAQRLRQIAFERFDPCVEADPRIGEALYSMDRLVSAEFGTVADSTFELLPGLNKNLRALQLMYFWEQDEPLEDETKTFPPLLDALSPLHYLNTLGLVYFDPPDGSLSGSADRHLFRLPSIRTLTFSLSSASALELVDVCPNVTRIDFLSARLDPGDKLCDGPSWPPLRALTLGGYPEAKCVAHRVGAVDKLAISSNIKVGTADEPEQVADLLALLVRASPVNLSLRVSLQATPMTFWGRVAHLAPRLRMLELRVSLEVLAVENIGWLDSIPASLSALPLIYLSIAVPKNPTVQQPSDSIGEVLECAASDEQHYLDAREIEVHRAQALEALPKRLMNAIPTLRFVSIGSGEVNKDNLAGCPAGRPAGPPHKGPDPSWFHMYVDEKMEKKHWRISGGGDFRVLQEMSEREAARLCAGADAGQVEELLRL